MDPDSRFRYERKAVVPEVEASWLERVIRLHPAGFRQLHPPRLVNSLYLDTPDHLAHRAGLEGLRDRLKVRVRWYGPTGDAVDRPVLELKVKRGLLGRKQHFPLPPLRLSRDFGRRSLAAAFSGSALPPALAAMLDTLPIALVNRYHRRYLVSGCGRFRLTLDTELASRAGPLAPPWLLVPELPRQVIVELKYDQAHDPAVEPVCRFLQLRFRKQSKYGLGLARSLA